MNKKSCIGILRFTADSEHPAEHAVIQNCAATSGGMQKNWQPLKLGGKLFFVTRLFPLTVIAPVLHNGSCEVLQTKASFDESHMERSYAARGINNWCSGGSNFFQLRYCEVLPLMCVIRREGAATQFANKCSIIIKSSAVKRAGWVFVTSIGGSQC